MWEKIIIASVSSTVTGIVAFLLGMRRTRAEVKKTEIEALKGALEIWQKTVDELRLEIEQLKGNNAVLQGEIISLRDDNGKLRCEISRLRYLNNRIIKLIENLTPHNFEQVTQEIKQEIKNIKNE